MVVSPQRRRTWLLSLVLPALLGPILAGALGPPTPEPFTGTVGATILGSTEDGPVLSGANDLPSGLVARHFTWEFADREWGLTVAVDPSLHQHYLDKQRLPYDHDYAAFVLDTADEPWVAELALALDALYTQGGISEGRKVDGFLAFAQHLPYALDRETTAYSEWPRYPIETLLADAVDCEDSAILFVSLLRALGHDVALLSPPRHMAAGVAIPGGRNGASFEHNGTHYYYAETTGRGWPIGKIPAQFADTDVRVIPLDAQPILAKPTWQAEPDGEVMRLNVTVQNVGDRPAHDVVIGAALQPPRGAAWVEAECEPVTIPAQSSVTCALAMPAPPVGRTLLVRAWADGADVQGRSVSDLLE